MEMKFFYILLALNIKFSLGEISCRYAINNDRYTCYLTIENSQGLDNFSSISGSHLEGYSDSQVVEVRIDSANSTIFPQIICQQFSNIAFVIIDKDINLQHITELSFASCHNLFWLEFRRNSITEVRPETLKNNVKLHRFMLIDSRITTLPENLFSTTRYLNYISISVTPTLTDLPANIFMNLNEITWFYLNDNRLELWRPEWTQGFTKLIFMGIYRNFHIKEVPRNAINSDNFLYLSIETNSIDTLDYFSFNNVSLVEELYLHDQPINAIDFNIIDGAKGLREVILIDANCVSWNFWDFGTNREENLEMLEPCFEAFDRRVLSK